MNKLIISRGLGLVLSLSLTLAAVPTAFAAEEDGLCMHHPIHNALCKKDQEKPCRFTLEDCGLCLENRELTAILGTDVIINGYRFPHTGQEIRPQITVTVKDAQLVEGRDYTLEYRDNIEVGTGTVTVTGIPEAGYDGIVSIPFTIEAQTNAPIVITKDHVAIEKTEFPFTGEAIEPAVQVTVAGTVLTEGTHYTLTYADNIQPGTGTVTVSGMAQEDVTPGYTGQVTVEFTILPAADTETQPEETQPEESLPEDTTEPQKVQIAKGDRSTWYMGSGKKLSFTTNGTDEAFTGVSINGKGLGKSYYTMKDGVLTLSPAFLNKLTVGKYSITIHFSQTDAEGTFFVSDQLDTTNPVTGDTGHMGLWISMAAFSLGCAGLIFGRRRKV